MSVSALLKGFGFFVVMGLVGLGGFASAKGYSGFDYAAVAYNSDVTSSGKYTRDDGELYAALSSSRRSSYSYGSSYNQTRFFIGIDGAFTNRSYLDGRESTPSFGELTDITLKAGSFLGELRFYLEAAFYKDTKFYHETEFQGETKRASIQRYSLAADYLPLIMSEGRVALHGLLGANIGYAPIKLPGFTRGSGLDAGIKLGVLAELATYIHAELGVKVNTTYMRPSVTTTMTLADGTTATETQSYSWFFTRPMVYTGVSVAF